MRGPVCGTLTFFHRQSTLIPFISTRSKSRRLGLAVPVMSRDVVTSDVTTFVGKKIWLEARSTTSAMIKQVKPAGHQITTFGSTVFWFLINRTGSGHFLRRPSITLHCIVMFNFPRTSHSLFALALIFNMMTYNSLRDLHRLYTHWFLLIQVAKNSCRFSLTSQNWNILQI